MNILLINHYAGSPDLGMEYRPYYMASQWKKMGHNVLIVCASQAHVRTKQFDIKKDIEYKTIEGIEYLILKTPEYQGNGAKRVLNMFSFVWGLWKNAPKIAKSFKPNFVIASSTYPLDIYPARKIAKKSGAKLVFEVHDLWPLSPMELGNMSKYHPFIFLMQQAENYAYKYCNHVISMLPKTQEHMKNHGLDLQKWHYIPNGILLNESENISLDSELITKLSDWKKNGYFLVAYTGGLGISNALEYLLEAATMLENSAIKILIFGSGPERKKLEDMCVSLHLQNVEFMGQVNKKQIPELLQMMDVLYLGWRKNPLYRFGISPNKLMDYMYSAKPIIHSVNAGNDLVAESNCGISVEAENAPMIAKAILDLKKMPDQNRLELGKNANNFVRQNHDYTKLAADFLHFLE